MRELKLNQLYDTLRKGLVLNNIQLKEDLDLRSLMRNEKEEIITKIIFENCQLKKVNAFFLTFKEQVSFINCEIESITFQSCFFKQSILFEKNYFHGKTDLENCVFFQKMQIENNQFLDFFHFFDCHFKSQFIFRGNRLKKENELFSRNEPTRNQFETPPIIQDFNK